MEGSWIFDLKNTGITHIFKNCSKHDPWNYKPVNLTSIPEKLMTQIHLETISSYMKDKKVIENS